MKIQTSFLLTCNIQCHHSILTNDGWPKYKLRVSIDQVYNKKHQIFRSKFIQLLCFSLMQLYYIYTLSARLYKLNIIFLTFKSNSYLRFIIWSNSEYSLFSFKLPFVWYCCATNRSYCPWFFLNNCSCPNWYLDMVSIKYRYTDQGIQL